MEITEVIRIVNLIKKVNCENYSLISETAKELGVKKTALMQYVEDNPKLFKLVEVKKGNKNCGLGIKFAYESAEKNMDTDEWLEVQKKAWEKKLHIFARYYYSCLEYYFIGVDSKDYRANEYRNTEEKINSLIESGVVKKVRKTYGGLSDCYTEECIEVNETTLKALSDAGWTTDFDEVVAQNK